MTFVETTPVVIPPIEQLEEMKPIKTRKKRAPKHDFKDGAGRVFAHKHDNGGGWVADSAKVDDAVYVGPRAGVFNLANVKGSARLEGKARVSGTALVAGGAILRKNAHVYGSAIVRDVTEVFDDVRVFGSAHVSGTSLLRDATVVCESAQLISTTITGSASISGAAFLVRSTINAAGYGSVEVKGDSVLLHSTIRGWAIISDHAQLLRSNISNHWSNQHARLSDFAIVADTSNIYYPLEVKDHAVVIRSALANNYRGADSTQPRAVLSGRVVLQHQSFQSQDALQNYLNLLAQHGGRLGAAQIMPNGQVANFPARQQTPPPAPGPRRIMRLQEAGT